MKKLFISRSLKEDSPLLIEFPHSQYEWTCRSLILFTPMPFDPPLTEWLFFYSPRSVDFFFDGLYNAGATTEAKLAAFGPGTAEQIHTKTGRSCDFVGAGSHQEIAEEIMRLAGQEKITFISGIHSMRSVQRLAGPKLRYNELSVYENEPVKGLSLGNYDVAILTSPMNARAFFTNGGEAIDYLSIGPSTARELLTLRYPSITSPEPSEAGLADALHKYINPQGKT